MRRDTLLARLHLRATQIATLNFWSQEENQIIGPLEGRKDGRYVSAPELWTAGKGHLHGGQFGQKEGQFGVRFGGQF